MGSPVELERGPDRQQHEGHHGVADGDLRARPRDDVVDEPVRDGALEKRPHVVPYLQRGTGQGSQAYAPVTRQHFYQQTNGSQVGTQPRIIHLCAHLARLLIQF